MVSENVGSEGGLCLLLRQNNDFSSRHIRDIRFVVITRMLFVWLSSISTLDTKISQTREAVKRAFFTYICEKFPDIVRC